MKKIYLFLLLSIVFFTQAFSQSTTDTYNASTTWTCPLGVTSVVVNAWGAGGGGGGTGANPSVGGGGAGGSFSTFSMPVTPGNMYTVTVGVAGTGGSTSGGAGGAGGDSWFSTAGTVFASGGAGGTGGVTGTPSGAGANGSTATNIGTLPFYAGGNGATGSSGSYSGAGGGGAGTTAVGGNATTSTAGTGGSTGGGNGAGGRTSANNGSTGSAPGGGGSGGYRSSGTTRSGGAGGAGRITITYTFACPAPTAVAAGSISSGGASISWTGSGSTYIVEYGAAGFTPGTGASAGVGGTIVTGTSPTVLSGLSANTSYDVYVRQDCSGSANGYSLNSTKVTFFTGYCAFAGTTNGSYFDAFTTSGGFTNINNTGSGYSPNGYGNFTAQAVSQQQSGTVNFNTSLVGVTVGVSIWVDWNDDLTFATSERVYNSGSSFVSVASGTITVPATAPLGNHRMRIVMDFNSTSPSACGGPSSGQGEAEDYTFTVSPPPACAAPAALAVNTITVNSANVTWTGTGTAFIVEYGAPGFTPGTGLAPGVGGTIATSGTNSAPIGSLSSATVYDVYVRQDCTGGGNGFSANSAKVTFATLCTAVTLPLNQGFNTSGTTVNPVCWSQQNVSGSLALNYVTTTAGTSPAVSTPFEGTRMVFYNSYSNSTTTRLVSAPINSSGVPSVDVSFEWYYSSSGGSGSYLTEGVTVQWSTDGTTWNDFAGNFTRRYNATDGWALIKMTLPAGAGNIPQLYIGLKFVGNGGYDSYLDAFSAAASPACPAPTSVVVNGITGTSASVSFSGSGSSYIVEYGPTGFTPGTGATAGTNGTIFTGTSPVNITGLSPTTSYDVYVRQDCSSSANGYSLNSAVASFTTGILTFTSVASGDWNNPATWQGNVVPSCTDNVVIISPNNITITTAGNVSKSITINPGGTLTVTSGDVAVGCTSNNTTLINNGTLAVSGGTLNVKGSVLIADGSNFSQSNGDIIVDGNNNGDPATSATGDIFAIGTSGTNYTTGTVSLTGGRILIVDPSVSSSTSVYAFVTYLASNSINITAGTNHTLQFGNGISTDPGGGSQGFNVYFWESTGAFKSGNYVVDALTGTNRFVYQNYKAIIGGNLTVISGEMRFVATGPYNIAGNVTVNPGATLTSSLEVALANGSYTSSTTLTTAPSTNPQTIGGGGTFANAISSPIAGFATLTVNNSSAGGVTLSAPISVSGTLNMTTGLINTSATNLLTLGTGTTSGTVGTLSYTSGTITGPFKKWIRSTATSYQFPVGTATNLKNAVIAFTGAPTTGGTLTTSWSPTAPNFPNATPLVQGTLTVDAVSQQGSWFVDAADGLTGGTYTSTFTAKGSTDVVDYTKTVLVKRPSTGGDWTLVGTHVTSTGSNTTPVLSRTGVTGFSEFAVGGQKIIVLPVSIEYFTGSKQGSSDYLNWKVNVTSSPSVILVLERSADGKNFSAIQTQNATATRCLQDFNYTDATPLSGINYYRLKIITPDGSFKYSNIIALLNKSKGFELISVAPNPVKNNTILSVTSVKAGLIDIEVSDVTGKVVLKQTITVIAGSTAVNLDFSKLSSGTYQISAVNADAERKTTRFVKF